MARRSESPDAPPDRPCAPPIAAEALAGDGQAVGQVRCQHAGIAQSLSRGVAGETVEIDTESRGRERREALCQQRADGAREDIACPAAGQGRILERCDRHLAVRRRDDGPGAFQHDDLAPIHRGIAGGRHPGLVVRGQVTIGGRIAAAPRPQPSELPGVRGQHGRPSITVPPVVHRRERAKGLRIEQDRSRIRLAGHDEPPDQFRRGEARPQARAR